MTKQILRGLFWTFTGTGLGFVLQAIVLVVLARLISPEEFGVVGAAMVLVNFSTIFSQLGIGSALVQHPNPEDRHLNTGFTLSILLGLLFTILITLVSPFIASFFQMEALTEILMSLSLVFFLQGLSVVAESLVKRELNFRLLTVIDVSSFIVGYGIFGIGLAIMQFGPWALVGATLIQTMMKSGLLFLIPLHKKRIRLDMNAVKELFYFGGGLSLGQICLSFATQGDNFIVGRWLGAEALGIYGRAYQLMVMPASLFGRIVDKVLFPALAKMQDSKTNLAIAFKRCIGLIALCVLPSSLVMFILAPEIIVVLLGPSWRGVILPFRILALGMYFRTAYKITGILARATGAVYNLAWRHALYGTMVLMGAWVARSYGIAGVAFAVVCALLVYYLLMISLSLRITQISWREFFYFQRPAFNLTIILIILSWGVALPFRLKEYASISILGIALSAICLCLIMCYRYAPRRYFGDSGIWLIKLLNENISKLLGKVFSGKTATMK